MSVACKYFSVTVPEVTCTINEVVSTLSFVSINLCLSAVFLTKVSVKYNPSYKIVSLNVAIPVKLSTDCVISVGIEKTKLLEGLYLLIARVATAYYFLHFLVVLPVLGFKEKTLPIPLSITELVLGGSANLAAAKNKESLDH